MTTNPHIPRSERPPSPPPALPVPGYEQVIDVRASHERSHPLVVHDRDLALGALIDMELDAAGLRIPKAPTVQMGAMDRVKNLGRSVFRNGRPDK